MAAHMNVESEKNGAYNPQPCRSCRAGSPLCFWSTIVLADSETAAAPVHRHEKPPVFRQASLYRQTDRCETIEHILTDCEDHSSIMLGEAKPVNRIEKRVAQKVSGLVQYFRTCWRL